MRTYIQILPDDRMITETAEHFKIPEDQIKRLMEIAYDDTRLETYQAMEGFLHNLNTMHSRGGNQVVFSSINYGTDTSEEGRMVIRELLKATKDGLGKRETPIFPIQIFKVKEGVNYTEEDYRYAMENFDEVMNQTAEELNGDIESLAADFGKKENGKNLRHLILTCFYFHAIQRADGFFQTLYSLILSLTDMKNGI